MLTFCGEVSPIRRSVQKGLKREGVGDDKCCYSPRLTAHDIHTTFLSKFTVFPTSAPIQCHAAVIHTECI